MNKIRTRIEKDLTELNGIMFLKSGIVVGLEGYSLAKFKNDVVSLSKQLFKISKDLYTLSINVKDFILNKIVSEKVIHDKIDKLLSAIANKSGRRAYVKSVPTFQTQRTRLLNMIKLVEYIENSANMDVDQLPDMDSYIENIAKMSGGVLKLTKPAEGSTFKNLKWNQPILENYEISQSPWATKSNLDQIKGLALTCKYDMVEKLKAASLIIARRCNNARKEISDAVTYTTSEDEYTTSMTQDEIAKMYILAYTIEKAIKQTLTQGLQKEINTFINTYLSRLHNFKYE